MANTKEEDRASFIAYITKQRSLTYDDFVPGATLNPATWSYPMMSIFRFMYEQCDRNYEICVSRAKLLALTKCPRVTFNYTLRRLCDIGAIEILLLGSGPRPTIYKVNRKIKPLFTTKQVAELFGVQLNTPPQWRKKGEVSPVKYGRRYWWSTEDIDKLATLHRLRGREWMNEPDD